uniref:Cilia and flagella associated protein 61 n=1 Tax=Serinus canaria TaxID=9135 RepID=A0A8C9NMV8_SERCA
MAVVTSSKENTDVFIVRRTESGDVPGIISLFSPVTEDVFGRIDVTYLLELSNLALTLCNEKNEVIAHAAFLDYPNWNITDQAEWEPFLNENYPDNKCTPLNTLFVHLFVAKEVPVYESLKETYGEYLLVDLLEREGEENQAAVCEVGGTAVGFMSLCSDVNISLFQECFDLGPFHGLCKPHPEDILEVPRKPSIQEGIYILNHQGGKKGSQRGERGWGLTNEDTLSSVVSEPCLSLLQKDGAVTVSPTEPLVGNVINIGSAAPLLETEEGDLNGGTSNVFSIRLFCIDKEYETRTLLLPILLPALIFQDRDLCVILVPHHVPEFPLIRRFVRAVPSCTSRLGRELYVFHRDGMPVQAFVAEVLDQIVGVSVTRDEMDTEYIRSHYDIEDFIHFNHHQQEEHGHLCHFVLNPVFHHYAKYFLKEILRLGHKSSLYYPIYPEYVEDKFQHPCAHSLTSALHYMAPVRPRRQIVYPLQELGVSAPSEQVSKDQLKYSLNHINRKLVLESKVCINTRIVVVGASDVGISFLETLIFWPRLKFNNLTLISIHGLPGKDPLSSKYRRFLINSHCFNDEDYAQMSLCSWVNVVVGKMTSINRSAKYVVVSEEKVPYDYLVLCTGQSYQVSCVQSEQHSIPRLSTLSGRYTEKVPSNHFTLNDAQDCLEAALWMEKNLMRSTGNIIVYGNTIDTYTTVEALLSSGIDGSRIHLVRAPLGSASPCLPEAALECVVWEVLAGAGVTVHPDSILAQWGQGHHGLITWAAFTTASSLLHLQCSAFFSFAYRTLDYDIFKAVSDACLVFDGRVVIDAEFHTNDASIRAAGPLTKFSRRYYRDELTHSNFNSKEIGFELAASMLSLFESAPQPSSAPPEGSDRLIPIYSRCKVQGGVLPGGYNYLHISKPGIPVPLDVELDPCDRGTEIVTGEASHGNYFRIHFSRYHMVDSITCFSKEPFPVSNYICLYGQHERLLNDLYYRWRAGQLTDLYSYFREPWSLAIYHDRFIDLQKELHQILMSEEVRKMTGECILLFRQKPGLPSLREPVLRYLRHHRAQLPMYAPTDAYRLVSAAGKREATGSRIAASAVGRGDLGVQPRQ